MATDYNWIYNSSNPVPDNRRLINVGSNPVQIAAAGLTECVDVYFAVGDCPNCGPGDVIWTPLANCGKVMQVCPDNNVVYLTVPGMYYFGDPAASLVLTGDVNIRKTEMVGLSPEQVCCLGKKCEGPQEVTIGGPLPLPVADDAGNTLLASILAAIVAQKDYEYKSNVVCNETTNTWHEITTVYVDGVAGAVNSVDLGVPCDQPKPFASDIEQIEYCDPGTNTRHIKVVRYDFPDPNDPTNVVEVVVSDTDTGVACEPITKESVSEVQVCANGVNLIRKTVLDSNGVEIITFWGTNGAVIAAPANYTVGVCPVLPVTVTVTGGGVQIAGSDRAALAPFSGAPDVWDTSAVGGQLQSITVAARSVTDGLPGLVANQVVVDMPDGTTIAMLNGETRTFSVVRDQDNELRREYRVRASGRAYANITYTFV